MTSIDEASDLTRMRLGFLRQRNGHRANAPPCEGWMGHGRHPTDSGRQRRRKELLPFAGPPLPIGLDGAAPMLPLVE